MASRETAFTHRTSPACSAGSCGGPRWNHSGKQSRRRSQAKQTMKPARTSHRPGVIDARAREAAGCDRPGWLASWLSAGDGAVEVSARRNTRHFSSAFTAIKPAADEQVVATNAVPTIADGFREPAAASTAMAVMGINWTEPVLIARKVHIALVAVPGDGFSDSRSFMARRPRGVAALTRPSILAAMFNTIEPMAGCS